MLKNKPEGLKYLGPDKIDRNPENPRIIFDEKRLQELKDSINEVGILVPLIVFYDDKVGKYILLDGERRLKCARTLKLNKVPANIVAKPTRLQNILEMFNIHNVRIEWGPMEVAWKIKIIIDEFGFQKVNDLSKVTSLKPNEIRRAITLLTFNKKYQDFVHLGPKHGGIKEDFLIELKPILNWFEDNLSFTKKESNLFIDTLIDKHRNQIIVNYVKDLRNLNKIVRSKVPIGKIKGIINNLLVDPKYSIANAYEESIKYSISINDIDKRAKRLIVHLKELEINNAFIQNQELLNTLKELELIIHNILKPLKS